MMTTLIPHLRPIKKVYLIISGTSIYQKTLDNDTLHLHPAFKRMCIKPPSKVPMQSVLVTIPAAPDNAKS